MRFTKKGWISSIPLILTLASKTPFVHAQDSSDPSSASTSSSNNPTPLDVRDGAETYAFQSDVSRLMRVVVSNLYHHPEVFLRELLSNSGDALEKLRFLSLTDKSALDDAPDLNITIKAVPSPDGSSDGGKLIIRDTGIGMSKADLHNNLGTIARSGTSEFLAKLENSAGGEGGTGSGSNLIGQFGLGFYSSFLVANSVTVTSKHPESDKQWIFESDADASSFVIKEDPNGNTLGRGTEIVLHLRPEAKSYLDPAHLKTLIEKHSEFATTSPIYVWSEHLLPPPLGVEVKEGEEDVDLGPQKEWRWDLVNSEKPLWMREPKDIQDVDYQNFYKALWKDEGKDALAWSHFKGDAGRTSFRALLFIPGAIPHDFFSKTYQTLNSARLFVRRVFITSDLGEGFLPKWLVWMKVLVDADDLPLNVGRDSLLANKDLQKIRNSVVRKALDLFTTLSNNDPLLFKSFFTKGGTALKLGAVEDKKNRDRIIKILRFTSSRPPSTDPDKLAGDLSDYWVTLDQYVENRKKGQTQIFFMAGAGMHRTDLEKSPFVERLLARGYEVLYFSEPMDEMIASAVGSYSGMKFQDVAKKGLKFGDEDEDTDSKDEEAVLKTQYEPLAKWIKKELEEFVSDVIISTRLTTSPCAVVTDQYAWTGNMERLMAAQNSKEGENFMSQFLRGQKRTLEINPKHPLVEGLLEKVAEVEGDILAEDDLKEVVRVLYDTALVRSGFNVKDTHAYFNRVESLLRRSVGVSETARAKVDDIRPAPEVEEGPITPPDEDVASQAFSAARDVGQEDDYDFGAGTKTDPKHIPQPPPPPPVGAGSEGWEDWQTMKKQLDLEKAGKADGETGGAELPVEQEIDFEARIKEAMEAAEALEAAEKEGESRDAGAAAAHHDEL